MPRKERNLVKIQHFVGLLNYLESFFLYNYRNKSSLKREYISRYKKNEINFFGRKKYTQKSVSIAVRKDEGPNMILVMSQCL